MRYPKADDKVAKPVKADIAPPIGSLALCSCLCHSMKGHTPDTCCGQCWTRHTYKQGGMVKIKD